MELLGPRGSRKKLDSLSLSAGEAREVEWTIGSGCRLEGFVFDQDGKGVADRAIWLRRAEFDAPIFFGDFAEVVLETRTDSDARFAMEDVGPGTWWIGPAAEPDGIAPLAEVIEILKQGWTQDRIQFKGEFYQFDLPSAPARPYQQNGGPLLYFGGISDPARDLCAKHCDVFLMWPETTPLLTQTMRDMTSLAAGTPSQYFVDAIEDSELLLLDPPSHQTLLERVAEHTAREHVRRDAGPGRAEHGHRDREIGRPREARRQDEHRAGHAERAIDAFLFENENGSVDQTFSGLGRVIINLGGTSSELHALAQMVTCDSELEIGVFTYDGDTPQDARRAIRGRAHVVLSNPDMIHSGINAYLTLQVAQVLLGQGLEIERGDNTARILDIKYHQLMPAQRVNGEAVDYFQWGALLRSVSAFRAYRQAYRDTVDPRKIAELLILDTDMPRSLLYCFEEVLNTVSILCGARPRECLRLAGEIHASLKFGRIDRIVAGGLHDFLNRFLVRSNGLAAQIQQDFMM